MFETISDTLNQCWQFLIIGFILGFSYELMRILRLVFKHNTLFIAIEDILYLSFCACICFIVSLAVGAGYFRIYYAIFALFGVMLYFSTLGRVLLLVNKKAVKLVLRLFSKIYKNIYVFLRKVFGIIVHILNPIFVLCNKFVSIIGEIYKKRLPNTSELRYNTKERDKKDGVRKNVIKGSVRKKA